MGDRLQLMVIPCMYMLQWSLSTDPLQYFAQPRDCWRAMNFNLVVSFCSRKQTSSKALEDPLESHGGGWIMANSSDGSRDAIYNNAPSCSYSKEAEDARLS
jgi:hypothetical protein